MNGISDNTLDLHQLVGLAVAALIGLAIGIERQWSGHASGPQARFGGMRTFFLLGLLGGLAGMFLRRGWLPLTAVVLGAGAVLVLLAYVSTASRPDADSDATTEVAALLVLVLAVLAAQGYLKLTGGICAVVVLVLREKAALHGMVERIGEGELRATAQFAVMALVVLPLLPSGPFGTWGPWEGIRPRALWAVVLLFSALSFAGYIARRIAGPRLGYPIAGLLGGLFSSTAATLHFSRKSRREPELAIPLAIGVLAACTVLLPRVAIVSAILNPAVALALLPYLAPPAVVGIFLVGWGMLRAKATDGDSPHYEEKSPLRLVVAIQMALVLQATILAITFVRHTWGSPGVLASAAVLGLTDVDALTLSMSTMGDGPEIAALGAKAIAVGILANTGLKLGLVLGLGNSGFRLRAASGLLAMAVASAVALWWAG